MAETTTKKTKEKKTKVTQQLESKNLIDRLVDALKDTGAVSILEDATIPGCEHFADRLTIRFQVKNDPAWRTYRLRIMTALANMTPQPKVHMCQQFMFTDRYTGKKQLLQVNTLEVEGTDTTVNALVDIITNARKGPIDARLAETQVLVGGVSGRVSTVKSERFTPSMTIGGTRGNAG